MRLLTLLDRLGAFSGDTPRRVVDLEANASRAFERLQRQFPALTGREVRVDFLAGNVDSDVVSHGLGEAPNRYLVVYSLRAHSYRFLAVDDRQLSVTRNSTTGDSHAILWVWRADGANAELL